MRIIRWFSYIILLAGTITPQIVMYLLANNYHTPPQIFVAFIPWAILISVVLLLILRHFLVRSLLLTGLIGMVAMFVLTGIPAVIGLGFDPSDCQACFVDPAGLAFVATLGVSIIAGILTLITGWFIKKVKLFDLSGVAIEQTLGR